MTLRYEKHPMSLGMGRFIARQVGRDGYHLSGYYLTDGRGEGLFFMMDGQMHQLALPAQFSASSLAQFKRLLRARIYPPKSRIA